MKSSDENGVPDVLLPIRGGPLHPLHLHNPDNEDESTEIGMAEDVCNINNFQNPGIWATPD